MAKLTWKELATEINAPTTAAAQARWTALGYTKVCSRCGGTGRRPGLHRSSGRQSVIRGHTEGGR